MGRRTSSLLGGVFLLSVQCGQAQLVNLASAQVAASPTTPQAVVQQAVTTERAANLADRSNWIYFESSRKPRERILQWVAATQHGDLRRVLERDDQKLPEAQQRNLIDRFLHDPEARKKQLAESSHDNQLVDDFLKLLPSAFVWTETNASPSTILLHFEPNPAFHPPTREARVFSGMSGDLSVDAQQSRIQGVSGHLIHDVTFGGGLLGRLKQGSSFSLEQKSVGLSLWQLTAIHVHLVGSALLFKSISLEQDNERSRFSPQQPTMDLEQAAVVLMNQPQ